MTTRGVLVFEGEGGLRNDRIHLSLVSVCLLLCPPKHQQLGEVPQTADTSQLLLKAVDG